MEDLRISPIGVSALQGKTSLRPVQLDAASWATDLALQTALRFGAGVVGPGTPTLTLPTQGIDLVRDANAVVRISNLQPQTGNPSPEAFQHSQGTMSRVLRSYQASPPTPTTLGLDLLA